MTIKSLDHSGTRVWVITPDKPLRHNSWGRGEMRMDSKGGRGWVPVAAPRSTAVTVTIIFPTNLHLLSFSSKTESHTKLEGIVS